MQEELTEECGTGIREISDEDWMALAMGTTTKAIYRLATGGRITHKGQTNARKIVEYLMDKYNRTAATLHAISRQLEAQEWGRLKTLGAPLYSAACKLKMPIRPEEPPRVSKDMQARINILMEQAEAKTEAQQPRTQAEGNITLQEQEGSWATGLDRQIFADGLDDEIEEEEGDATACQVCGDTNPKRTCTSCLEDMCHRCIQNGCSLCGVDG